MDSTGPPAAPTALYTNAASPAAKPPSSTPSRPPNGGTGGNRNKNNNKNRNSGNDGGNNGKNSNSDGGRGGSSGQTTAPIGSDGRTNAPWPTYDHPWQGHMTMYPGPVPLDSSVRRPSWPHRASTRLPASCPGNSSSRCTSRPPRPQAGTPDHKGYRLDLSTDHKGYRCLDLSTNRLIVSRHVIFDGDSFPLAASPNPTDLDFLCESGSTVSTVVTRLTTAGTVAPCQPSPEVPPGFEPPALAVPPEFLPRAAPTAAPRAAPASTAAPRVVPTSSAAPTAVPDGPPPREWPASPIAYVRCPRQPTPAGTTPPPTLWHLLQEVRAWWCLSRLRRILIGWSHGRRMASECYLIDSSSLPRLRFRHHPRSRPPFALPSPIPIGA
jgi:hypothetical protein